MNVQQAVLRHRAFTHPLMPIDCYFEPYHLQQATRDRLKCVWATS